MSRGQNKSDTIPTSFTTSRLSLSVLVAPYKYESPIAPKPMADTGPILKCSIHARSTVECWHLPRGPPLPSCLLCTFSEAIVIVSSLTLNSGLYVRGGSSCPSSGRFLASSISFRCFLYDQQRSVILIRTCLAPSRHIYITVTHSLYLINKAKQTSCM